MRTEEQRLAYNAYMREFRKRPGQIAKETARKVAWINDSPENTEKHRRNCARAQRRARWGSPEEYAARLATQRGICALCRQPFDDTELGKPVQDHNHVTGELRKFLHRRCNLAIGHLLESPAICHLAAEYLEHHK